MSLRKDVINALYGLADSYDSRADSNVVRCELYKDAKDLHTYFFAEGKTFRNTARDLRTLADSYKIM